MESPYVHSQSGILPLWIPIYFICFSRYSILEVKEPILYYLEYFSAENSPTEEDIETVIDFFAQKTKNEDNDFIYSILKTLCRMCQDANQPTWSALYNKIVKIVQDIYKSRHNGKSLYLSFKLNIE